MKAAFITARSLALTAITGTLLAASALLTHASSCVTPPSGLVSWWPGEGNTSDVSGTNTGIFVGTTAYGTGEVGQAFSFDGSSYVSIPDGAVLDSFTNQITIELWLKANSTNANSDWQGIVTKGRDSWRVQATTGAKTVYFAATGSSATDLTGTRNVNDGLWHHVAAVYDGTNLYLYVDGTLDVAKASTGAIQQNSIPAAIGATAGGPSGNVTYFYNGLVDEPSIYNRALSSNEVAAIYSAGTAGKCGSTVVVAPSITQQPTNQTVTVGGTARFVVGVSGTTPLSFQWRLNGTNLVGYTGSSLVLSNVQSSQAGNYSVLVTNLAGSVLSSNAVLTVTAASPSCDPVPSGLVSWWQGESNANDAMGLNNGTLSATGASYGVGKVGAAFRFDGTNGYVQIPDADSLKPTNVTLEAWVWLDPNINPTNINGEQIIFKKNTMSAWFEGYSLLKQAIQSSAGTYTNHFQFVVSRSGNQVVINSVTVAQRGVWYHVAATYDGNQSTLYVNGVAEATAVAGFALDYGTDPVYIGTSGTWAPYLSMFGGMIDEPSIYNRVLSSNEIAAIYSAGSAGKCGSTVVAPSIIQQPTNLTVTAGGTARFVVGVSGTTPLSFQWRLNGTNLVGNTGSSLVLSNVQSSQAGNYSVLVTNLAGSVLSSNAVLTVQSAGDGCVTPPSGLVAWWPAEGSVADTVGGNLGTVNGTLGYTNGEVGQAFLFNGIDSYISVPAATNLNIGATGTGLTIEAWVRPDAATYDGSAPIVEWDSSSTDGLQLWTGKTLYANLIDTNGVAHPVESGTVFNTNAFQHVALTYDQVSGLATLYYNGSVLLATNVGNITPQTTYGLNIGRRTGQPIGAGTTLTGAIDELSLYNRALTSNEVAAIYSAGTAGKCSSSTVSAPSIITQPTNQTVTAGDMVLFRVGASGTAPLYYQWMLNGTNLVGYTGSSLVLSNVQVTQAGNYSVLVTNLVGSVVSSNALLTVVPSQVPPTIVLQTWNQVVQVSNTATFSVVATGSSPLGYFWFRNGTLIAGVTNAAYALLNAQLTDSGSKFSCVVSNAFGTATSTNMSLKVIDTVANDLCSGAILITNANYTNAQSTLKATAFGDPLPDCVDGFGHGVWYQFFAPVDGRLVVDTFGSDFDTGLAVYAGSCDSLVEVGCNDDFGGVTSQVTVPAVAGTTYYILAGGYAADAGNLVLHSVYLTPPMFVVQPTNEAVVVSSNASFAPVLSGSQPMSLQWYFNNQPLTDDGRISGSTNVILNIAAVQTGDAGNYQLVASNIVGVVTSSVAVLTPVVLPPVITQQPVSQIVPIGSNAVFSVQVAGTPPYGYQWYDNGVALVDNGRITGSTTASLSISNVISPDVGSYQLIVTNISGAATSSVVTLTLPAPPVFIGQPRGYSVPVGLQFEVAAFASANPAPAYQWQLNGTNIPGATKSYYTNSAFSANDVGIYHLVASNWLGTATSQDTQMGVGPVAAWGLNNYGETMPPVGLSNVIAVAGNIFSSFALRADGSLVAWGGAAYTNVPSSVSNGVAISTYSGYGNYVLRADGTVAGWGGYTVPTLSNIVSIAAGSGFGYAVRADGILTNWGGVSAVGFPAGLNHVTAVAAGYNSALALRADGTVVAAGSGVVSNNLPKGLSNVVAVAVGYTYGMALKADGRVVAWGVGSVTNVPSGLSNVVAIAAENTTIENLAMAIRANGSLVTWGDNNSGLTNVPVGMSNVVTVACAAAQYHSLALVNDGRPLIIHPPVGLTAYVGRDVVLNGGAVGTAPLSYQWLLNGTNIPGATSSSLVLSNVQLASAGNYQLSVTNSLGSALSLAAPLTVISNKTLVLLGQTTGGITNYQGSVISLDGLTVQGNGPLSYQWYFTRSTYAQGASASTAVAGATNATLVLDPALAVQSGYYYAAISNQFAGVTSAPVPVTIYFARSWGFGAITNPTVNVTNAVAIATASGYYNGYSDYFAVGADGKVSVWANYFPYYAETNISALSNSFITAIAAGNQTTLALKSDGTVTAWGYGYYGQTNVPAGLSGVTAVACGGYHELALKSDGTTAAWGASTVYNYGQTTNNALATNVVAIAAGQMHNLVLRADGNVVTWGYNGYGQTAVPLTVTNNVVAIAAGANHNLALLTNGTVVQWGNSMSGYPVPTGLTNVVAISAGTTHSTALRSDGTVVSWGYEYVGLASTNVPADLANVAAISSGGDHDVALFGARVPAFTVQPWDRAVATTNTPIWLAGKCVGVQPIRYQWQYAGTNLPGATNDILTLGGVSPTHGGRLTLPGVYQLVASNSYGVTYSSQVKLSVIYPLSDAVDATNLTWTTTGNGAWYGETSVTHDGVDAARSGAIGASQETILQTTVRTNTPGLYTFWWKVSSEQYFDILEFRINGVAVTNISGEVDWQHVSIPVAAGTNVLQWRYSKDASFDAGQDAAWVDQFAYVQDMPLITGLTSNLTANAGSNVTFSVTVSSITPVSYQWTKGTSVLGTNSTMTLPSASRAQEGMYLVSVTNLAGGKNSGAVTLKVLVPQVLSAPQLMPDGSLHLTSADADGGSISAADLSSFTVQFTTNLVDWQTLTNGLSVTNGTLLLRDSGQSNSPARFYRIIEH